MTSRAPDPSAAVSRETRGRLEVIVEQLRKWQPRINLVAPSTLPMIQQRHVEDSLQLLPLAPGAKRWIDLGSGGGFPGLAIAAALADRPGSLMVLIESNGKKCAFLRETARLASLPVEVRHTRIETLKQEVFDVVSARALAPLGDLLQLAEPFLSAGAIGLFPKGQDVDDEVAAASKTWLLDADLIQSRTYPGASIVRIRSARRRLGGDQDRAGQ